MKIAFRSALAAGLVALMLSCGGADAPAEPDPQGTPDTPGTPVLDPAGDEDHDGLTNQQEANGWDIQVDRVGLGEKKLEHVASDPRKADTDGDGLTDAEEFQKTDPTKKDTDGDTLSDYEEVRVYLSVPVTVDTDGDSVNAGTSSTQLWDGDEVKVWGSSPSLADTDGDGRSDYEEIIANSTNPLVAQVPELELSFVGNMDVRLDVTYGSGSTTQKQYGQVLALADTTEQSRTDSVASTLSVEASVTVGVEASAGFPESSVTASASATLSAGYSQENSTSLTSSASRTAQQEYQKYVSDTQDLTESTSSGRLSVGMKLKNASSKPFKLTNLTVTAFQFDPLTRTFKTVATLTPVLGEFNLGPLEEKPVAQQVVATGVNAGLIKEFLKQPSALSFRVSNFDLQNAEGTNYAFLNEVTNDRTGLLVIDYGDGRVERYRVATNVRRNADGSPAGVPLKEVFEKYIKVPYATAPWQPAAGSTGFEDKAGKRVLTQIKDKVSAPQGSASRRFWALFAKDVRLADRAQDFDNIVLQRGQELHLAYVSDDDKDGLLSYEERLYGSSDSAVDTDHDTVSDFDEVRTGWTAGTGLPASLGYPRQVFSDPTSADADNDGSTDAQEKAAGTDPYNPDTDNDQLLDGSDAAPLSPFNSPPSINLTLTSSDPTFTLTGSITDTVDAIASASIAWGDGATTPLSSGYNALNASHAYAAQGTYTITVSATDARGAPSTKTFTATSVFPTAGLVGFWRLNGNFSDSSGGAHHLTLGGQLTSGSSGGFVNDRAGNALRAYDFQGDNIQPDYSYAAGTVGAIDTANFSVALWINASGNTGADGWVVSQQNAFAVRLNGGRPSLRLGTGVTDLTSTTSVGTGTWKHVAWVKSGSTVLMYVNGTQVFSGAAGSFSAGTCTNLFLGGNRTGGCQSAPDSNFMPHQLDDVRVYSRALSAAEVTMLMNQAP
ncbi:hypothetical protein FGE12_05910 [Aggregicoccus sp. 17bor-14]|uniref:LamG-like jellyroll fold domain-containing protein n=1 Tax=Myxococcaceae TaxID=31 RepID=UPI00129C344B|nr:MULTISPECIES: LamG-like jellyroll fold domain-containing protein [Myxococcaceae]MBF5041919.1 hypothetical protein [Simulacricoccus sp. 17bor-14]MRI87700.1 hypothetical protein [Aggregicoccus sp. 17bor-14]